MDNSNRLVRSEVGGRGIQSGDRQSDAAPDLPRPNSKRASSRQPEVLAARSASGSKTAPIEVRDPTTTTRKRF